MTIRFVLMVNKQGQTRLAQYYETLQMEERCALEAEVIRKCLSRTDTQCSFYEFRGYKVVYRRYASLFFIVGVEGDDENELAILEFIHALVETLDRYFENVVRAANEPACNPTPRLVSAPSVVHGDVCMRARISRRCAGCALLLPCTVRARHHVQPGEGALHP
jgi:AP-4 complex subunit sigma-1